MSGIRSDQEMSRRHVLLASGAVVAAPLALAACGSEEEDSSADNADLLNQVLAAQLASVAAAKKAQGNAGPLPEVTAAFVKTANESVSLLESYVTEADGSPTTEPAEATTAESPTEALARQLESAIEDSLAAIGEISEAAYRQGVHRIIVEDAATLAAVRSALGEDIAPDSFVFGPATPEPAE